MDISYMLRNVKTKSSYSLKEPKTISPLAQIANKLTELVRSVKTVKKPPKRWQQVIQEIKEESSRLKSKKRNKERMKQKFSKFVNIVKETGLNPKKALKAMDMEDLFADEPLSDKEQELRDQKEMMEKMSPDEKAMYEPIKLVREGIKLGMLAGGNKKDAASLDDKKIALLSPQFMSLLPDESGNDTISLLSPDVLSLHGQGSELEKDISLSKAMDFLEMTGQNEWMSFAMEASGVTEAVDRMKEAEKKEEEEERRKQFLDAGGHSMEFTRENANEIYGEYEAGKIDIIGDVYKTMSNEQMEEFNKTGYTIMDDKQVVTVYGPGSPYNDSEALNKFLSIRKDDMPAKIEENIRMIANEEIKFDISRKTLDFIIRDEDVADVPDEDGHVRKINTITHDGNKSIITISDEAREDLYKHWVDQSLAGLMGAVVTNVINKRKMSKDEKKHHYICVQKSKNVTAHAKCVVTVLDQLGKRNKKLKMYSDLMVNLNVHRKKNRARLDSWKNSVRMYDKYVKSGAEEFRVKRKSGFSIFEEMENKRQSAIFGNVKTRSSYTLHEQKTSSPLAQVARKLTELVRSIKNTKGPPKRWQEVIQEIKEESQKIKSKKKNKERMKHRFSKFVSTVKETGIDPEKALKTIGMDDLFADEPLTEKEQEIREKKEMLAKMSSDEKIMHEPIKLIREALKLGMLVAGDKKGAKSIDDKKIALLSPQFMSLIPDADGNDTVSLLSPNVLSLHGEGSALEREISLTKALRLLESTGQNEWMNFVMEASGVTEAVDKMKEAEKKADEEERRRDFVDKDGKPIYFTKENATEMYGEKEAFKIDLLDGIYKSMNEQQMESMNKTGYTIMDEKQIKRLYGPGSPYNDSEALEKFLSISKDSMPARIEENIRMIAREEMKFEISRKKDVVLSPIVLVSFVGAPELVSQTLVLSPLLLSPLILSPAIYGNVILSPWVFVPLIVSPRVLGAVVLSPIVFSPLILTPICLVPLVLSPGVGTPLILSPMVLSPFILSPVVMNPLILTPFALSPFIGVPNVLNPLILSPFVLSPLILSPPFVSAFILSPYALSPAVLSNGALFTAVLSPSWLSTL